MSTTLTNQPIELRLHSGARKYTILPEENITENSTVLELKEKIVNKIGGSVK